MARDEDVPQFAEQITRHIKKMIVSGNGAIEAQYRKPTGAPSPIFSDSDPLGEEIRFSPVKGLVHKYGNRILWKVSYRCAAHCQFCTRARQIGTSEGDLSEADIQRALAYVRSHPTVDDVILSGGDPFFTPTITATILNGLSQISTVRAVRIGTRLPVQSPLSFETKPLLKLMELLGQFKKNYAIFILIHFNHPTEITDDVVTVINRFHNLGIPVLSQTVFLRGINDRFEILRDLFRSLYFTRVIPYYIYRCDYAKGLERYVCDLGTEREIMTRLTSELSGIAVPTYVVDVAGRGKIPIPLNYWTLADETRCTDFDGRLIELNVG